PGSRSAGLVRWDVRVGNRKSPQYRSFQSGKLFAAGRRNGEQTVLGRRHHRSGRGSFDGRSNHANRSAGNRLQSERTTHRTIHRSFSGFFGMTLYEADWICPISSPPVRNGSIGVENGTVAAVYDRRQSSDLEIAGGPRSASAIARGINDRPPLQFVRFPGCAIIPGFVNAHAHLELTILRGFLDDLPFSEWIPKLTRAKYEQLSRDEMLLSARLGCMEMIRAGVTCLAEVMDLGTAWPAMREFGLRGIAYQEVFGPAESQVEQAVGDLIQKVDDFRDDETETFRIGVSPHAPYTVSAKLYEAVNWYAQQDNLRMTTHIAESEDEGMFVRWGAGVFAERWTERGIPLNPPGCSPVAYLNSLELL